jgi:hypothetical protein
MIFLGKVFAKSPQVLNNLYMTSIRLKDSAWAFLEQGSNFPHDYFEALRFFFFSLLSFLKKICFLSTCSNNQGFAGQLPM